MNTDPEISVGVRFEIVYSDGTVIAGTTAEEFAEAPEGVQFVIVEMSCGRIVKHKALSIYEYQGATKTGDWCQHYEELKRRLPELSTLLSPKPSPARRRAPTP